MTDSEPSMEELATRTSSTSAGSANAAAHPSAALATETPPPADVPVDVSILDDGLKSALTGLWASVQRDRPKR